MTSFSRLAVLVALGVSRGALAQTEPVATAAGTSARGEPIQVVVTMAPTPTAPTAYTLDNLKAGKLVENGFTLGAGLAAHVPVFGSAQYEVKDTLTSFMPYLVVFPGLLFAPAETRRYCSTAWMFQPPKEAQAAADQIAIDRVLPSPPGTPRRTAASLTQAEKDLIANEGGWVVQADTDELRPACQPRLIGLYVGKPLGIAPEVAPGTGTALTDGTPDSTSVLSGGIAWVPNIGITLFAGVTWWRFSTDVSPRENVDFATISAGIGGNLDVLGALLK